MKKVFKTDKAPTWSHSSFRTFEMFGIQDKLYNPPTYLKWCYEDVQMHLDSMKRVEEIHGRKLEGTIVKCLVTITDRELPEDEYHWTEHLCEEQKRLL